MPHGAQPTRQRPSPPSPRPRTPAETASAPNQTSLAALRARTFDDPTTPPPLGSIDGMGGDTMLVEFSPFGSGIASLKLGEGFFKDVGGTEHVELQAQQSVQRQGRSSLTAVPFAALAITVSDNTPDGTSNSSTIGLAAPGTWRAVGDTPGHFEAFIDDADGNPVLRLDRRYSLTPGTFRITIDRTIENLTDRELTVAWQSAGPIDLPMPVTRYGGDKRRVRFGYLFNEKTQAGFETVTADGELMGRGTALGKHGPDEAGYEGWKPTAPLWPNKKIAKDDQRLVWCAFTDRYFGVAVHPIYDPATPGPNGENKIFEDVSTIDRLVLNPYLPRKEADSTVMIMRVNATPETIAAGTASTTTTGVYAGPLLKGPLTADPLLTSLNLNGLIAYNFGGPCGEMCTFSWLTYILMGVLRFTHSLVGDWALAIIILVLIVRTCLHPITKWSQIRLQRFSKQMQAIAPKQQKIREKYKDDQKRQQQEMAKLWQEEGINPAGALGCLPMLLQSPVWIALYATLYFATELRHEAAFWGVFQKISGGEWMFLADLARPDRAIPLPASWHFTPPLVGGIYGEIRSINLLPVLMGVVFFLHQKYLSPPPSASMSAEMEQQQKIMKVMFPLMMPIFMYAAPSGLTIYFITNSTLGILENKHIRSSAEKKGLLDPEKIKAEKAAKRARSGKPDKPGGGSGGFMAKLQALAEQQQAAQQQKAKKVQNTARKPEVKDRNYKKRK
jgi:YidC/Oxa1 family membrane protein insertase